MVVTPCTPHTYAHAHARACVCVCVGLVVGGLGVDRIVDAFVLTVVPLIPRTVLWWVGGVLFVLAY